MSENVSQLSDNRVISSRRGFLQLFGLAIGGLALEQAIPFNRVWSFPSQIVVPSDAELAYLSAIYYDRRVLDMLTSRFKFSALLASASLPHSQGIPISFKRYHLTPFPSIT